MALSFRRLLENYPTQPQDILYQNLGGQWPTLIGNPNYKNTCAIRLSVALRNAGMDIPQNFSQAMDGDGEALILKVVTMRDYLHSTIGLSTWAVSKSPGSPISLPAIQGIIAYHANWGDATGHFDLWTGNAFVGPGDLNDVADGYAVEIWRVN